MIDWTAANLQLRADRDAMNEHKRLEAEGAPIATKRRFTDPFHPIEAMQHDGTPASARAIAKAFPQHAALDSDGGLVALSIDYSGIVGLRAVPAASWLVDRDMFHRRPLEIVSPDFMKFFKPAPESRP